MSGHSSHSYQNTPYLLPSTSARNPTSRCHYYSSKHERADLLLAAPRPCWSSGLAPENAWARTSGHRRGEPEAKRTRSKWRVQRASHANVSTEQPPGTARVERNAFPSLCMSSGGERHRRFNSTRLLGGILPHSIVISTTFDESGPPYRA